MRAIIIALVLLALLAPQAIRSEIIEIPMPELQGWYSHPDSLPGLAHRMAIINFGQRPLAIHGAWIVLSGEEFVGLYRCSAIPSDYAWPYFFYSSLDDTLSGGYWRADFHLANVSGQFQITTQLDPHNDATWNFLTNDLLQIHLFGGAPGFPAMCGGVIHPYAFIQEATFKIDADFEVPVAHDSWGSIKALYIDD